MSGTNFRGGRKPFPKPSAFESEIHPPHKTPFCTSGISPLQGADSRKRKLTVRKSRAVFIHAATKGGAYGCCCFQRLHFWADMQQHLRDFAEVPACGCQKATAVKRPVYGYRFAVSRPMAAAHKESGGIRLSAKGKEKGICEKKFIYRNGKAA